MYALRSFIRLLSHGFFRFFILLLSFTFTVSVYPYLLLSRCPYPVSFTSTHRVAIIDNAPSFVVNCDDMENIVKIIERTTNNREKIEDDDDDEEEEEKSIRIGMRIIILTSLFFLYILLVSSLIRVLFGIHYGDLHSFRIFLFEKRTVRQFVITQQRYMTLNTNRNNSGRGLLLLLPLLLPKGVKERTHTTECI